MIKWVWDIKMNSKLQISSIAILYIKEYHAGEYSVMAVVTNENDTRLRLFTNKAAAQSYIDDLTKEEKE
jgi:hypothetical protein